MTTVAELLVQTLADIGVRQMFGVVGDALNPFSEASLRGRWDNLSRCIG